MTAQDIHDVLQILWDHKMIVYSILVSIYSATLHAYLAIWHAGGVRTIWKNFMGPKESQPNTNETKQ